MDKYHFSNYVYFERWASYWQQINEVLRLKPTNVLEVGVGGGLVANYLKSLGVDIKTCDIDGELKPDFAGSVEHLPFEDNSFEVILCAEVLEHLPFEKFSSALWELKRVSGKYVILSLPHWGWTFKFCLKIPLLPPLKFLWKISGFLRHKPGESSFAEASDDRHQWEIGKRGFSLRKIKKEIQKTGFKIPNHFIPFENPYHHFFILQK